MIISEPASRRRACAESLRVYFREPHRTFSNHINRGSPAPQAHTAIAHFVKQVESMESTTGHLSECRVWGCSGYWFAGNGASNAVLTLVVDYSLAFCPFVHANFCGACFLLYLWGKQWMCGDFSRL